MGKIIMIGAMKGGVGKSVTAFNLAYSLQKRGKKVLAVDFDPQSNLTTCFGAEDVDVSIGDLMMNVIEDEELPERDEYIWERNGVDFIPSSIPFIINAAEYGTPQKRERVFFIGIKGKEAFEDDFLHLLEKQKRSAPTIRELFRDLGPAGTERNPKTCNAKITYAERPVMRRIAFLSRYAAMLNLS